jgi:hypothetical protein
MSHPRTYLAVLAAAALLLAACSSSGGSPAPLTTSGNAGPTSAVVAAPPAPTNFTATRKSGSVPCPTGNDSCSETDLAWQSTADPGTWFRVYWAATGEDPNATCVTIQAQAETKLDTKPAATSAQIFDPMAVGGGETCWWISALNSAGESTQVPATGQ